jgi:hypothetical protein
MLLSLDTMRASNPETKVESRDIDGSAVSSMLISLHLVEFIMFITSLFEFFLILIDCIFVLLHAYLYHALICYQI